MRRRALVGTVAMLGLVALVGLFASLFLLFSSPSSIYAQGTNNSAPTFTEGETADRSVDENTAAYTNIGDPVTATDSDTDDRLTYSIKNARTSPFTIVRATGQLQVGQPLDHETKSSYEVVVQVTDSEDADGNFEIPAVVDDTITVTITVNNVDDPGKVSLTWTKLLVGIKVEASLTDSDGGVSVPTWQWEHSTSKTGTYTPLNGADSITYTPQTENRYVRAVASYTDSEGGSKKAHSAGAYVRTPPDSNLPPAFDVNTGGGYDCDRSTGEQATVCLYVKRFAQPGDDIYYPARASDPDTQDQVHYSLSGTDYALFHIDKFSGELLTTEAHAYNSSGEDGKFDITITATDPHNASDSITAAIRPSASVTAPVVRGPSTIRYPENGTWPLATYSASISGRDIGAGIGWIIGC